MCTIVDTELICSTQNTQQFFKYSSSGGLSSACPTRHNRRPRLPHGPSLLLLFFSFCLIQLAQQHPPRQKRHRGQRRLLPRAYRGRRPSRLLAAAEPRRVKEREPRLWEHTVGNV